MDLFEAIKKRHSYRGSYKNTPVKRDDLVKIVETALMAPSGKNAQLTEFMIVDDVLLVDKINKLQEANKAMQEAKAYIICIIDKDPIQVYEGLSFQLEDCSAAVQNMLLTITAMGYASVWIDGWLRVNQHAQKIAQFIDLPDTKKVQVILPIGIPAEEMHPPKKKPFEERVYINSYLTL